MSRQSIVILGNAIPMPCGVGLDTLQSEDPRSVAILIYVTFSSIGTSMPKTNALLPVRYHQQSSAVDFSEILRDPLSFLRELVVTTKAVHLPQKKKKKKTK